LPREQNGRQKKAAARKMTRDGMEERNENLGNNGRPEFNLRIEQTDIKTESPECPRYGVNSKGAKNKPEHSTVSQYAAKYTPLGGEQPGNTANTVTDENIITPEPTADIGTVTAMRETEPQAEQPPVQKTQKQFETHATPRSAPGRPGKLRHGGKPNASKETPKRKPVSPFAAKYTPAGEPAHNNDAASDTAEAEQPEQVSEEVSHKETKSTADSKENPSKPAAASKQDAFKKPSKLRFSEDETAQTEGVRSDAKLGKARAKAVRSAKKLNKAQDKLPKKRNIKIERTFDDKSQKSKRRLVFEEEVKSRGEHIRGSPVTRPLKSGANAVIVYGHRKLYQAEHENVGTQAAHQAEIIAEAGLRSAYRLHKTAPYRNVEKLTRRTTKLNNEASYQKALSENPKFKSSTLSRMAQKRKIKRQYAKAAREAKKAGTRAKRAGQATERAAGATARFVARHPVFFIIAGILFLLIAVISGAFASCSNMAASAGAAVIASSYLARDEDIDRAILAYTEWETDLQLQINNVETDMSGYDEYRYRIGNIGHTPYELISYLTAKYREFTYEAAEEELRILFGEQYVLDYTEIIETRYDEEGEPYEWKILSVTLTSRSFEDVTASRLTYKQRQHYQTLLLGKGNRQYSGSPFDFNWSGNISGCYGYRVHPISGAKDYHKGIDIAVPTGTDIYAGHDGTVSVGYDEGGYGHYITLTGADGLVTKYAHLDSIIVSAGQTVKAGDIIAGSGNTGGSTGPHLHFEVIKNGRYLDPSLFAMTHRDF
jgi:murein DD-endopeptidase MepM/ murein hydrolase activator NlpD